ncbi:MULTISPECIES: glycine oxidase ThiO [Rhizobium]|uniref:D-amino-acid oxidase n=1 Tax=Rhizobium tropici TaxID=398 RepID=A0A329YG69_RHITR|nr:MULTISPECIES: glycine oxidase ThiO [Rhizobium]MBB3289396.1 glycine oxidase [Rhizobium sp. BK252]MBB3404204.1 glycine oxidase [Rhizobium sp. BK289]MBB3416723.1 glycine oxidase [Rhizobium sp. BK284]MBB3484601.1 glycine oxidase [Rhizobium sp. BK347]MDK4721178.1 glycine oxidase ThiO [Rhizobium sp. CNPSo 3968]
MRILVKGAGVAGLTVAHELHARGAEVTVADPHANFRRAASWLAGGMLAPWCERESADEPVLERGRDSADRWDAILPGKVVRNGTLVVAPNRDQNELKRFASRTTGYRWIDEREIAALEPFLAGRFRHGLFFPQEAHLDPRDVLQSLKGTLSAKGVTFVDRIANDAGFSGVMDCTGAANVGESRELRGVRGEMLYLQTQEVALARPVRLLHPRFPVYIVPRGEGLFMIGATMIETDFEGPITARSLMELLNAAYALHPAFADAAIVETGAGIRPAFPDNLPRVTREGKTILINGLYRHGFLLAPAMAAEAADLLFSGHNNDRSRQCA